MELKSYMKKNIFDITLLCFTRNKWNQFVPGPKYFASREQFIEIYHPLYTRTACWKWQHFTRFIFENKVKVESLLILVVLKRQNVDYYEHQCIFYSVTQEKVQFQHFMGNNKSKKKANYQQFLSQRQFSVYYSLVLKKKKKRKNKRFNVYGGVNKDRMFAFLYLELKHCRLQWDVSATSVSSCLCVHVCSILSTIWLSCCIQCVVLLR